MTAVGDIRAGGCLNLNQPGKVSPGNLHRGCKNLPEHGTIRHG